MNKKVKYVCEKCGHIKELYVSPQPKSFIIGHCSGCHPHVYQNETFLLASRENLAKIKNKIQELKVQVDHIKNSL